MSYSNQNGSFKSFVVNFVNWFLYRVTCSVLLQENSETSRNDQNWTFFKLDKPCYLPYFWLDKGFKRSVVLFLTDGHLKYPRQSLFLFPPSFVLNIYYDKTLHLFKLFKSFSFFLNKYFRKCRSQQELISSIYLLPIFIKNKEHAFIIIINLMHYQ